MIDKKFMKEIGLIIVSVVLFIGCSVSSDTVKMTVASEKQVAVGVAPMDVFLVKEGDATEWTFFYSDIEGFDYDAQYGNYVIISHGGGWFTMYAHGRYGSVIVSPGQKVERGQKIMTMGDTGYSYGQHLHFELVYNPYSLQYSGAYRIDPLPYLKGN